MRSCGDCGHPLRPSNDGFDRCPICESEFFISLRKYRYLAKEKFKSLTVFNEEVQLEKNENHLIALKSY